MKKQAREQRIIDATWRSFCDMWYWIGLRMLKEKREGNVRASRTAFLLGSVLSLGFGGFGAHLHLSPARQQRRVLEPPKNWDKKINWTEESNG